MGARSADLVQKCAQQMGRLEQATRAGGAARAPGATARADFEVLPIPMEAAHQRKHFAGLLNALSGAPLPSAELSRSVLRPAGSCFAARTTTGPRRTPAAATWIFRARRGSSADIPRRRGAAAAVRVRQFGLAPRSEYPRGGAANDPPSEYPRGAPRRGRDPPPTAARQRSRGV